MTRIMRNNGYLFYWLFGLLQLEYAISEGTCERGTCLGERRFGYILPRSAFRTRFQVSLYQCATECLLRKQRCKSFNYRRIYPSCQLCEEDSGPGGINLRPERDSIHSNIDTWKYICVGLCNEIQCSWTQKCDPSNPDPKSACVPSDCPFPEMRPGVTIDPSNETSVGTHVWQRCELSSMERGNRITTCLESTAEWSATDFKCVCKNPPVIPGAITATVEVEVGQTYTYRCQDGLFGTINQNPTITCLRDSRWTATQFTCACKTPPVIPGAINETVEVEVGQNYTYRCIDGLFGTINQNPTITCLVDGTWTPTNFTCVCKTPPALPWTLHETVEVEVGQTYTYRCQNGLFGKRDQTPTVTCLRDGQWTATQFTCVCTPPPAKSGTLNSTIEVEIGQNYTYKCHDGLFAKAGQDMTVTCLPDGSWTSANFTCVCNNPPTKSGAIIETVEVEVGQNYTYQCKDDLFGKGDLNPTITCLENGSWTATHFQCVKQNWKKDIIYLKSIYKSDVISAINGIDLLACMQQCDDYPNNCLSFFYDNNQCILSSSYKRGLPQTLTFSSGLVYYTVPLASCDMGYVNVSLGGAYFCIKLYPILKTYNEAMQVCESEKAKLLVVTTEGQVADLKRTVPLNMDSKPLKTLMLFAQSVSQKLPLSAISSAHEFTRQAIICLRAIGNKDDEWTYVGISDEITEGNWIGWNGETVYPFWNIYEPNGGTYENCGVISPSEIGLNDIYCYNMLYFVCNKI